MKFRQRLFRSLVLAGFCSILLLMVCTPLAGAASPTNTAATCPQPPAGVDLSKLPASTLAYYGLPQQRPNESHAAWVNVLAHARHRSCTMTYSHTKYALHTGAGSSRPNDDTSKNWGGYIAFESSGWPINVAESYWQVPGIPPSSPDGDSATWVGVGGYNNNNLVQAGTEQEIGTILWWRTYTYRAWIENYGDPSNPYAVYVFNVRNTDNMNAYIQGNYMFIEDLTSNTYSGQSFGPSPDPSTAEYIEERAGGAPLADFQSVTMNSCSYESIVGSKWKFWYLGNTTPLKVDLTDGSNNMISVGSVVPNGNFTMNWLRSN